MPCCAGKIDCCPHIKGFIEKKNCFAGIDIYKDRQANDYEKWGNTTDITREKDTEITKGRVRWKYRSGNEKDS